MAQPEEVAQSLLGNRAIMIRMATWQDYDGILQYLLSCHLKAEPLRRAFKLTAADALPGFTTVLTNALKQHPCTSFVIVHSNNNQQILGVALTSIHHRHQDEYISHTPRNHARGKYIFADDANRSNAYQGLMTGLLENTWQLVPTTARKLLKGDIISVRPDLHRNGIANAMFNMCERIAIDQQCQGIFGRATAYGSQQLFKQREFIVIRELFHKDCINSAGVPIIKCDDKTISAQLVYKDLSEPRTKIKQSRI